MKTLKDAKDAWEILSRHSLAVRMGDIDDLESKRKIIDDALKLFNELRVQICTDSGVKFGDWRGSGDDDMPLSDTAEARLKKFLAFAGKVFSGAWESTPCLEGESLGDLGRALQEAGLPAIHWKIGGKKFRFGARHAGRHAIVGGTITSFEFNDGELAFCVSTPFLLGREILSLHRAHGEWLMCVAKDVGREFLKGSIEFE